MIVYFAVLKSHFLDNHIRLNMLCYSLEIEEPYSMISKSLTI